MMLAGITTHSTRAPVTAGVPEESQYKEVRGLTRGLDLLRALNSTPAGAASTSFLANACGIHRTTAKRLLETLRCEGLVRLGHKDGFYVLSEQVLELSRAMHGVAWISDVVTPVLEACSPKLMWPCDFATYSNGQMVLRESTHRWCRMARHPGLIGETMQVTRTALGRAFLAGCEGDELEGVLLQLRARTDACGELARDERFISHLLAETRARGWAENKHRRSRDAAIAMPVRGSRGMVGSVNMIYSTQLVTPEEVHQRLVPQLRELTAGIAQAHDAWHQRGGPAGPGAVASLRHGGH